MWVTVLLVANAAVAASTVSPQLLDLPPRYMWGWEPKVSGYCGSVSTQTASIFYGNWLTEDAIRGTSGGHDAKHELLILYPEDASTKGTAISSACKALMLNCTMWNYKREPSPQHTRFLSWTKEQIDQGHPVIIGLYWGVESDKDYDHIVPMVGYEADDGVVSAVYFNDLHTNGTTRADVSSFVTTRKQCNEDKRFGPGAFCLPRKYDYGIAVNGNLDTEGVLLPVRLEMDSWTEPDYSKEDEQEQVPVMLSASVTASGLTLGTRYAMLRFDDPKSVPAQGFLNAPYVAKTEFKATGHTWTQKATFMSNSTIFFRCVRVPSDTATTLLM